MGMHLWRGINASFVLRFVCGVGWGGVGGRRGYIAGGNSLIVGEVIALVMATAAVIAIILRNVVLPNAEP